MHKHLIACLIIMAAGSAQGAVVANASVSVDALTRDELRNILLGNKTSWDGGGKIALCTLQSGDTHEKFLDAFAGKSTSAFSAHWKKLVFTGKAGMPPAFAKDDDLLAQVAKTTGAIGYVADGTTLPAGVKAISIK
jgi:ABC-type phosphate transport system substrate-binding protein